MDHLHLYRDYANLYAFDMDDTLVNSPTFEDQIRGVLESTSEEMLIRRCEEIGVSKRDLKYENGRIFLNDPLGKILLPKQSIWVRKGNRIYITQPEEYNLSDESLPSGINPEILNLYKKAQNKAIITARSDSMRHKITQSLKKLNIEMPNKGLFMYPHKQFSLKSDWKAQILSDLSNDFPIINYYDDNAKMLRRIKQLSNKERVRFFKVTDGKVRGRV